VLAGIFQILQSPFSEDGAIDWHSFAKQLEYCLAVGVHGLVLPALASEFFTLSDAERRRTVEIVADELAGGLPLVIGIAPNSLETALEQARHYAQYQPAALMTLPPPTMDNGQSALIEFYVALGQSSPAPIMLQQSPHIPQYRHCALPAAALAEIARRAPMVRYFKIEGPGSAATMAQLRPLLGDAGRMFGGGGGISALSELRSGAAGLIPGVGFNEIFLAAWRR